MINILMSGRRAIVRLFTRNLIGRAMLDVSGFHALFVRASKYIASKLSMVLTIALLFFNSNTLLFAQTENLSSATDRYTHEQKQELADHALHILGGNANVISRWNGEFRLALVANDSTDAFQHVEKLVSELADVTGLQGRVLETPDLTPSNYLARLQDNEPYDFAICESAGETACANLVVVVADIQLMRELATAIPLREVYQRSVAASNPHCFFAPFIDGRMTIRQAFVYVRDDLDDAMTRTCLQEEIYQSFGLFNDASGSAWFSFNNKVEPKNITELDKLLLKTVYSSDFRAGMPAYVVVRKFLGELDNAGER